MKTDNIKRLIVLDIELDLKKHQVKKQKPPL